MPPKRRGNDTYQDPDPANTPNTPNTPRRNATAGPSRSRSTTTRKRAAPAPAEEELVPDVFKEMVREDVRRERKNKIKEEEKSSTKRRKLEEEAAVEDETEELQEVSSEKTSPQSASKTSAPIPTTEDNDGGEGEDEDSDEDIDWENVDLSAKPLNIVDIFQAQAQAPVKEPEPAKPAALNLVLHDTAAAKKEGPKRRQITAVDRKIRLEVHKLNLICLISHVRLRNRWCNDAEVQENLRPILPQKVVDKLHDNVKDKQFRRSVFFMEGLNEACEAFRKQFKITHRGLTTPQWLEPEEIKNFKAPIGSEIISKEAFVKASKTMKGSRDLGAQVFCALLRAHGITTRLVSSLQVLSFSFTTKKVVAPLMSQKRITVSVDAPEAEADTKAPTGTPTRRGNLRRPGRPPPPKAPKPTPLSKKTVEIVESLRPIYWVEAWNIPAQKWICVDPLVTNSVGKPKMFEPAMSDHLNTMSYVLAFEETGHTVDVTRRYAKWLLAKTRRLRIGSTKGGERWWKILLRRFERKFELDRDQIEEAEFAKENLHEEMPNNIEDFKDHPIFALKRHLKRGEVIYPERSSGTVSSGKGKVEKVYRREDVKVVKTREQWYKLGRTVAEDQMPRKFTKTKTMARKEDDPGRIQEEEEEDDERPHQPMFEYNQTELYVPPPVEDGMVPKNRFGNIDLYVPSMVPKGGVHIPLQHAAKAAQLIGVDYTAAVTGFEFRNRAATAKVQGVVVAEEYGDAIRAVVEAFEWEAEKEEIRKKASASLKLWKRFLFRLQIRQTLGVGTDEMPQIALMEKRIKNKKAEGKKQKKQKKQKKMESEDGFDDEDEDENEGGFIVDNEEEEDIGDRGFLVDGEDEGDGLEEEVIVKRTSRRRDKGKQKKGEDLEDDEMLMADNGPFVTGGGLVVDIVGEEPGGGFMVEDTETDDGVVIPNEDAGGGFVVEEEEVGGGFVVEDGGESTEPIQNEAKKQTEIEPEANTDGEIDVGGDGDGGGFVAHDDEQGGGFLPDAESTADVEAEDSEGYDFDYEED
ncbi:Similar to DNA repair protein rhp41; acc. no. Q10445 [Pyronema omphalodes CBS 100304]|uniref:Similar to DNA repair protein rhp41 acc. no. Q10445 n=1 Tax=Pyronema omphalodes (strain CBS 100304) TaxID=1076935 RepID=U4LQT6_PYROM|nr:Similar to DNA repair protein rhp41; acc. no. Q10445 [Pyronema omphalodes CBS 100304]